MIELPEEITRYLDRLLPEEIERVMTQEMDAKIHPYPDELKESKWYGGTKNHCLIFVAHGYAGSFRSSPYEIVDNRMEEVDNFITGVDVGYAYDSTCRIHGTKETNEAIREYLRNKNQ